VVKGAPGAEGPAKPQWAFRSRLRRGAFGWKGTKPAITRIDETLSEIRAVARHDAALAGEGAVIFLEKLSPALCDIDSSSGELGNATHSAVALVVPIIAAAPVTEAVGRKWLDRLFEALQEDDPPYIESLGDFWGDLCATPEIASSWVDRLLPTLRRVNEDRKRGTFAWFKGTMACYSALFAAGRHDELLALLESDPRPFWSCRLWGARVFAERGQVDEAIAYAESHADNYTPMGVLAEFAEELLLKAGRRGEAYDRYAIEANQANSRLATYRAIAKKYPELEPDRLLGDLIASTPGDEGIWFATAKTLKRFELAAKLAWHSPCDTKTLNRAARDHLKSHSAFAAEVVIAALYWMSMGYGYELTGVDVREAWTYATDAATSLGDAAQIEQRIRKLLVGDSPQTVWMRTFLGSPGR